MDLCSSVLIGEVEHVMDFKMKEQIKDTYLKFASLGERVLGEFLMHFMSCNTY